MTYNSITIGWGSAEGAATYSVFVNGDEITNKLNLNSFTITDLESAGEYFIKVKAYDNSGKELFTSNEICAHTNLTINSNYTLTKDLKAANIIIKSGNFNLNGYSLSVDKDVWITSGTFTVNKGSLYVGGDLNVSSTSKSNCYGRLSMNNSED